MAEPGSTRRGMQLPVLLILVLIGMIVLAAAGIGAGAIVYDHVSRLAGDCDERFGDNSPAAWSVRGISSAVPDFDARPLFVADYEEMSIPSRDSGIELRGWWLPSRSSARAPSIVVVHGLGTCVRDPSVLAPAGMLHRLGYEVLLVDLRDHGGSTVEDGRPAGGTNEYRDVLGAVDWLVGRGAEAGRIGVLGTSMGAVAAIIAAGQDERIAAVWADSAYSDIETRIAESLEEAGLPRLLAPLALLLARLVSGDDLSSRSAVGELAGLEGRQLFITHGELDGMVDASHAERLLEAARSAGVLVDGWLVADTGHHDAMLVHAVEYERRLAAFFGAALGTANEAADAPSNAGPLSPVAAHPIIPDDRGWRS
jgi:uncharacterized protein